MASSSVSFRISRSAEDLAATIHALSQRLVSMEQRLEALEIQLKNHERPDPQDTASLENVDRLLQDCRALLELDGSAATETVPAETALPIQEDQLDIEAMQSSTDEDLDRDLDAELLAA